MLDGWHNGTGNESPRTDTEIVDVFTDMSLDSWLSFAFVACRDLSRGT